MVILFVQSCAVAVGGSASESFSTTSAQKSEAEDLSGGGAMGLLVAVMWLVGAAFVISKPRASMWVFAIAGVFALLGGSSGFSDLYIWGVVSFIFALMSWRGSIEKEREEAENQARYHADVQAAATRLVPQPEPTVPPPALPPAGWYADPTERDRLRWWDGERWTEHYHPPATPPPSA